MLIFKRSEKIQQKKDAQLILEDFSILRLLHHFVTTLTVRSSSSPTPVFLYMLTLILSQNRAEALRGVFRRPQREGQLCTEQKKKTTQLQQCV